MVQRAEREPTVEEIAVALRETRRSVDGMQPFAVVGSTRGSRAARAAGGSADLADLRDSEIERLLAENARLNARVIALLKIIEQEQARNAEIVAEATPIETDAASISREVTSALEAELSPILLVLLRLLQQQYAAAAANSQTAGRAVGRSAPPGPGPAPSDWIVELMHSLEDKAPAPDEAIAAGHRLPRRARLRQCVIDMLHAFGFEPHAAGPAQRFPSPEERH